MKHLKRIFESNEDRIKTMAKVVFEYIRDFESSTLMGNIDGVIRNAVDFDEDEDDEYNELTLDEITNGITNIVSRYGNRRYDEFLDFYNEIEIESQHGHELEVIDDLLLNSGYKYNAKKSIRDDQPVFIISMDEIEQKDILKVTTYIWSVVAKRLPGKLFISTLHFFRKKKNDKSDIQIIICDGDWNSGEES